ncbi:nanos homolog 2-like [Palaemon carinicauda]|uniref:nanos homolog 2-like n=1 Tax=Palaemon carinicauda TaxID=392227 RepID=UPI0035B5D8AB
MYPRRYDLLDKIQLPPPPPAWLPDELRRLEEAAQYSHNSVWKGITRDFSNALPSCSSKNTSQQACPWYEMPCSLFYNSKSQDPSTVLEGEQSKYCGFCKTYGAKEEEYRNHHLRDVNGKLECGVLRKYVCPICSATGDDAHTVNYCPLKGQNKGAPPLPVTLRKTKRNSTTFRYRASK